MNKKIGFLGLGLLAMFVIGSFSFSVFAQDPQFSIFESKNNIDNTKFVPEQLIVGLKTPDPNFHAKASLNGGQVIASINQINAHLFKVPEKNEEKFIQAMSKNPNVQYVERNGIVKALDEPNDSWYYQQWGTERIGMESVWSPPSPFDKGSGITIAVIDEGVFWDHPDFTETNFRLDIDKDFVNDDFDTRPTSNCFVPGTGFVSESHGTFVTGVIAATINNNLGIAGVGQFDILPLRVLNACGSGNLFDVADAIMYAADQDVDVINLSLGHESWNHITLENAVNYASGFPDDIVIVAASGNGGNSLISYPAGFEKVISVGATDFNGIITDYSQYGPTLDLSAPGGSDLSSSCSPSSQITWILTTGMDTNQNPGYYCVSGTSFAAPLVAATAGLLKASSPCATEDDIKSHLEQTALDLGASGRDDFYGHGRVRADVALSTPLIPTFPCGDDETPPVITLTGANPQIIEAAPLPSVYPELGATAFDDVNGDITSSIVIDASAVDTSTPGSYLVTYNVADAAGNNAVEVIRTVNVVDTTPPVITLLGSNPQTIELGSGYTELGATTDDGSPVTINSSEFVDAVGSYSVYYDSTDGTNAATTVIRTVIVVNTSNSTPAAYDQTVSTTGGSILITLTGFDADGDSLTFSIVSQPPDGRLKKMTTISDTEAEITYTPKRSFAGTDSFEFMVNDGIADSNVAIVSITEEVPPNTPPVANNDSSSTAQNTQVTIDVLANDTDANGDNLTVYSTDANSTQGGIVTNNGDDITYTPPANFIGIDTFTYIVFDGTDPSNSSTVTVEVTLPSSNNPPVINAGNDQTVTEKTLVTLQGTATDPDGDSLTYQWVKISGPKITLNGDTTLNPTFNAPNVGKNGKTVVLQLTVDDGTVSVTDNVTINIANG